MRTELLERRAKVRELFKMPYEVGDILHHSWGYDQTNCDFYQVTKVKGRTIELVPIGSRTVPGSEGSMCDSRMPVKDDFHPEADNALYPCGHRPPKGQPLVKRVTAYLDGNELHYFLAGVPYGSCTKWDGSPCYCSWYA